MPHNVVDSRLSVDSLVEMTFGFSGADLENLVNEAAISAARANAQKITTQHFDDAYERITCGVKMRLERTRQQLKRTAYHEAGHALVQALCKQPVTRVTILPRGKMLGATMSKEKCTYLPLSKAQRWAALRSPSQMQGAI